MKDVIRKKISGHTIEEASVYNPMHITNATCSVSPAFN